MVKNITNHNMLAVLRGYFFYVYYLLQCGIHHIITFTILINVIYYFCERHLELGKVFYKFFFPFRSLSNEGCYKRRSFLFTISRLVQVCGKKINSLEWNLTVLNITRKRHEKKNSFPFSQRCGNILERAFTQNMIIFSFKHCVDMYIAFQFCQRSFECCIDISSLRHKWILYPDWVHIQLPFHNLGASNI